MSETLLKYNKPAENFNEALPIGNGRMGGMIFGKPAEEIIKLNEDSVWSGSPRHRINPDAQEGLSEVRELLKAGNIPEAEKIAFEKLQGVTPDMRRYMPLGNLYINNKFSGKAKEYSRTLDISTAVSNVKFIADGKQFKRNIFCSAPDEVMVIYIHGDTPASITMECFLDGRDGYYDDNRPCGKNMLMYTGGSGSKDGIFFAVCLGAKAEGGEIRTIGGKISVKNADSVMLILSARTSFYTENYIESAEIDTEMALQCSYDELYFRHVNDYKSLFERVEFSLNDNGNNNGENPAEMNTDERIARLKGDEMDSKDCERLILDNKLMELYFNFGRYLMISASRPGTQPMNLQGIWNEDMIAPWGSKYTININTEMNYWCAENCNLSECHLPLFELLERVCENGKITAREMYGINEGYVCHHNTDIWGDTAPQDLYMPATIWVTGGAWLALHVFEHYEYTLDKEFLAEKYHLLKESAEFFLNYLTEDSEGRLVTCPSVSPENTYLTDKGVKGCLCIGPSMDSQIITVLFNDVIKAAEILGKDKILVQKIKKALEKLPKPEIGKYGQIKEWAVDYDEVEAGHRHVSQLFALHPADLITPAKTPKLADAARATLVRRLIHGGGHTGWSCAWIANMWARLYDSRMVYENLKKLLTYSTNPNMTCNHPPFQIAGNFGGVSAIVESLLQCTAGEIIILPALPDEWQEGYIKGLRAKGGFGIDIEWSDCKLKSASITPDSNSECRLRLNCIASIVCEGETVDSRMENGTIIFNTTAGKKYTVRT
ncbi:MAG: glycoside hydrolase family 95 protein [Ruminococcus sp.]|nr:glycoside hydrolase family 95 protein [Ruminococcus sp.]